MSYGSVSVSAAPPPPPPSSSYSNSSQKSMNSNDSIASVLSARRSSSSLMDNDNDSDLECMEEEELEGGMLDDISIMESNISVSISDVPKPVFAPAPRRESNNRDYDLKEKEKEEEEVIVEKKLRKDSSSSSSSSLSYNEEPKKNEASMSKSKINNNKNNNNNISSVEVPLPTRPQTIKASDIVKIQKASGAWSLKHVEWITGLSIDKIKSGLTAKHNDTETLEYSWATAIVVAILQSFFASTQKEWNLVDQKARKFVKRNANTLGLSNDLLSDAEKFVTSQKIKL